MTITDTLSATHFGHLDRLALNAPITGPTMLLTVELEQAADGNWLAEISDLAGVLAYGASRDVATARAEALALRVLADRLEYGDAGPDLLSVSFVIAEHGRPIVNVPPVESMPPSPFGFPRDTVIDQPDFVAPELDAKAAGTHPSQ